MRWKYRAFLRDVGGDASGFGTLHFMNAKSLEKHITPYQSVLTSAALRSPNEHAAAEMHVYKSSPLHNISGGIRRFGISKRMCHHRDVSTEFFSSP